MYYGNFDKLPPEEVINYTPYEYGSYMHYGSNTFAKNGNSMIPHIPLYLRTLGSRVISFYDIKTINDHYLCNESCGASSAVCANGGEPNPRNCAACNCPSGYGGALCNQRVSDFNFLFRSLQLKIMPGSLYGSMGHLEVIYSGRNRNETKYKVNAKN
ncbi:astacin [Oesophagostomum dentatum]|uniref:Metalloendopeptidase n=1 Tax=Oesophagostomum dentatum TaxID=61180 RepID=A0A0B1SSC8_OESDE|nr:astacin [Oesophagostomum dentatum]